VHVRRRCGILSNYFDQLYWRLLQDEYDDDGDLRPQYRRLSLHSAAASSRALLSAVSARILHVTPPSHSPPPASASAASAALPDTAAASTSGAMRPRSSVCALSETRAAAAVHHQRRYHSFRSALRPGHRARLSFDSGQTARTQPPHNTST